MNVGDPNRPLQIDEYAWGRELIIWGYEPSHQYTFKILEPKAGRAGCLSLQYHSVKSESWLVLRGMVWALLVVNDTVCARIMRVGEIQNIPCGVIHRLMGVSLDAQVAEPSTPDKHAADKSVVKDVVRLHCLLGREVVSPRDERESRIVQEAARVSLEAADAVARGEIPREYNKELLLTYGALNLKEL